MYLTQKRSGFLQCLDRKEKRLQASLKNKRYSFMKMGSLERPLWRSKTSQPQL